jgi:hypothetical protein
MNVLNRIKLVNDPGARYLLHLSPSPAHNRRPESEDESSTHPRCQCKDLKRKRKTASESESRIGIQGESNYDHSLDWLLPPKHHLG